MAYRLLADVTMVVHFVFLAYVVAGGFLAWRWPQAIWPHLLAVGWGLSTLVFHLHCPLTWLEDWSRRQRADPRLHRHLPDRDRVPRAIHRPPAVAGRGGRRGVLGYGVTAFRESAWTKVDCDSPILSIAMTHVRV